MEKMLDFLMEILTHLIFLDTCLNDILQWLFEKIYGKLLDKLKLFRRKKIVKTLQSKYKLE